ncbi:phosphatase PAP2 family protein [Pontibacter sp. JH31]|uniref:Phosphatase PAP2 family protein n=1 Tax=Pontibacter aquaedesilientis TaxID=2766980 RepID=A0ABR7XI86_9BACT|nr:phosphatase PAP2 family protein [Pontibacter aquaedesilientis]MBD1397997.1 phosphatase PAP2 family protein [Pontibacter aquaedesilientis]
MKGSLLSLSFVLYLGLSITCQAQSVFPYKTDWVKDGAITAGGIGLTVVGSTILLNKDRLTEADLQIIRIADVNRFDRFAAGNYSASAEQASDFPFYGSFVAPLFLLLDDDVRLQAPQVYLLYAQAMSITGGLFSMTAGLTERKRPNVYATDAPLEARLHKYATNSFFAGHTAATATATFFAAKVFHDFNPDSPARHFVWAAAAITPATVGYLRLRAGKHFLTDNIIGYTLGASVGILVPQLHKKSNRTGLSIHPTLIPTDIGPAFQAVNLNYTF